MEQFLAQKGGIGGDENQAGQGGAELGQHPIRAVRRANGDMLAGQEAIEERARDLFGAKQQCPVAPAPPRRRANAALDQRRALAPGIGGVAQRIADAAIEYRLAPVRRHAGEAVRRNDAEGAYAGRESGARCVGSVLRHDRWPSLRCHGKSAPSALRIAR
jgi:hypothetical protein